MGSKLVDAKAVATLHRSRISGGLVLFMIIAALVAVLAALAVTDLGHVYLDWIVGAWHSLTTWVKGLFS